MRPGKPQFSSKSERQAADFVAAVPPANSSYPTLNFNGAVPAVPTAQYPTPKPVSTSVEPSPQSHPSPGLGPQAPPVPQGPEYGYNASVPTAPSNPMTQNSMPQQGQGVASVQAPPGYSPPTPQPGGHGYSASAPIAPSNPMPQQGQGVASVQVSSYGASHMSQPGEYHTSPPHQHINTPHQGIRANKKAVIVGCNYFRSGRELKGCINDALNIEYMLQRHFGFCKANVRVLTDDGHRDAMPTKSNIFNAFNWLMQDLQRGDSLFFHFSGRGLQREDYSGDERDGMNETLLPCDFNQAGHIIDDEINQRLVNPLPNGVYLHAIIDAGHSGTAMDLEFYTKYKHGRIEWRSDGSTRTYKGTNGGIAVLFSACSDSQVALETKMTSANTRAGAATQAFIEAVERYGTNVSYGQILNHMYETIDNHMRRQSHLQSTMGGHAVGVVDSSLLRARDKSKQTPQISCNMQLNLNEFLHI